MNTTNALTITTSTLFAEAVLSEEKTSMFLSNLPIDTEGKTGTFALKVPAWILKGGLEKGDLTSIGELLGDDDVSISCYLGNYKQSERPQHKALKGILDLDLPTMQVHIKTKVALPDDVRRELTEGIIKFEQMSPEAPVVNDKVEEATVSPVFTPANALDNTATVAETVAAKVEVSTTEATVEAKTEETKESGPLEIMVNGERMVAPAFLAAAISSGGTLPKGITLAA